jgi:hypothetical protein
MTEQNIWICEIRLPLSSLGVEKVEDGEVWRLLFARDYSQADQNAVVVSTNWRFSNGSRHYGRAFYNNYLKEDEYARATLQPGAVAVQTLKLWNTGLAGGDVPEGKTRSRIRLKNTGETSHLARRNAKQ